MTARCRRLGGISKSATRALPPLLTAFAAVANAVQRGGSWMDVHGAGESCRLPAFSALGGKRRRAAERAGYQTREDTQMPQPHAADALLLACRALEVRGRGGFVGTICGASMQNMPGFSGDQAPTD